MFDIFRPYFAVEVVTDAFAQYGTESNHAFIVVHTLIERQFTQPVDDVNKSIGESGGSQCFVSSEYLFKGAPQQVTDVYESSLTLGKGEFIFLNIRFEFCPIVRNFIIV